MRKDCPGILHANFAPEQFLAGHVNGERAETDKSPLGTIIRIVG